MSAPEQNLQNHVRTDPVFHFLLLGLLLLNIILCAVHFYYQRDWFSAWLVVVATALLILLFKMRTYPLRVQDRIIRLEERLRLSLLAPPDLRPRISELTEAHLVALRFAPDDELPALAAQALNEHLTPKEIKKRIAKWRPDHFRI
ncbi:MAG TPA: DUF6526 family protein [Acidobacteriaceae bacterium]|jgi:hypothetical protein